MRFRRWLAVVMTGLLVVGCGKREVNIVPLSPQQAKPIASAEWVLAERFLARNLNKYPNESWVFSPTSLSVCATMLREGLEGKSNQELAKVLGQQLEISPYRSAYKTLCSNYSQSGGAMRMAQAMWVREGFEVRPSYSNSVKDLYRAKVTEEPFDANAIKHINEWANHNTDGMIDHLLDEIGADSVLILLQATLFHDDWLEPFKPSDTTKQNFTTATGKEVECDMMGRYGEYMYSQNGRYQAVEIPYKTGFKMRIVLPAQGKKLSSVLDGLILTVRNPLSMWSGLVQIPKWSTEVSCDLMKFFVASGAKQLFQPSSDFAKVSNVAPMNVSKVIQKAKIIVDEQGTKAAAVTETEVEAGAAGQGDPFEFIANRPFVYAIISPENLPVFIGVVNNPTAKAATLN